MPNLTSNGRYGRYIDNLVTFSDFGIFNIAFVVSWLILDGVSHNSIIGILVVANIAFVPVSMGLNRLNKHRSLSMETLVRNALFAVIAHLMVFTVLLYLLGLMTISSKFYYVFYPIFAVMLMVWEVVVRKILKFYRKKGRNFTRVIIIGTNATAQSLYREMMSDAGFGYRFMGFFADDPSPDIPEGTYKGKIHDVKDFIAQEGINEVFYTLSGENNKVLQYIINATEDNVARFFYVPQINRYVNRGFTLHNLGSVPVLSLMDQPLENHYNRAIKRIFDVCFSSLVLVASPIIFIPVAIAIKASSPGPIFFRQLRTGYKGRDFYCWKFRTMRVNADADNRQATRDDPRKTRVGDFLRKTSIDELPQFINVWLGTMSVVGPRPHMLSHTEEYRKLVDQYMVRHYIKPGITGWAQVNGLRGQTDELWKMEQRVEFDVWYIKHWTFLLDLKIILKTVANAVHGEKNAF